MSGPCHSLLLVLLLRIDETCAPVVVQARIAPACLLPLSGIDQHASNRLYIDYV